jgi:predicted Zn-dependent protease with MMP-like domain
MRLADFEALVRELSSDVPQDFLDGITEVVVSPRTVPHPDRAEIFTLGECVPLEVEVGGGAEGIQSRIVLYHGSFEALASTEADFDWRMEAWETLTHELRHHLEWRARAPDLEDLDWALEHNFARHDGEWFDPTFFLSGERQSEGVYLVEEDVFIERLVRSLPPNMSFGWDGRGYLVNVPEDATLPCFLTVSGVVNPPGGDLILALRQRPALRDLFSAPQVFQANVQAIPQPGIF